MPLAALSGSHLGVAVIVIMAFWLASAVRRSRSLERENAWLRERLEARPHAARDHVALEIRNHAIAAARAARPKKARKLLDFADGLSDPANGAAQESVSLRFTGGGGDDGALIFDPERIGPKRARPPRATAQEVADRLWRRGPAT